MSRRKTAAELERLVVRLVRNEHVRGLVDLLIDEEVPASVKGAALRGLITVDTDTSWDALSELVVTHEGHVVELAVDVLREQSASQALRVLGECLGNLEPFARSAAVRAIAQHNSAQSLNLLLRASRDPEPAIGRMAARCLMRRVERQPAILAEIRPATAEGVVGLLDTRWAMEYLADVYPDPLRVVAARRLGQLGGEEAASILVSVVEVAQGAVRDACFDALESCRSVPVHVLLPLLAVSTPEVRSRAVSLYARSCDRESEGMLAGLASDPEPQVRTAALRALARLLGAEARDLLEPALSDAEPDVRLCAVEQLCGFEGADDLLADVVNREAGEVRRRALIALANRGVVSPTLLTAYTEFLLEGANVTDLSDVAYLDGLGAAARALGQANTPEGLIALTGLVRSVIKRLRRIAIEGIMSYPADERGDALHSLQDTYDMDVLKNVAFGLHEGGDRRALVPLVRTSYECKGRPQLSAQAAVKEYDDTSDLDFLVSCLGNRWPSVRRFGAERLKVLHDARSIPALLDASRDGDVEVQLAVFEALSGFAAESDAVVERMLEAIGNGDISVRQMACEALGEARCQAAVPDLIKALYNFFLRPRASEALRRIGDRKGYLALKRIERREALFPKKPLEILEQQRRRKQAEIDS